MNYFQLFWKAGFIKTVRNLSVIGPESRSRADVVVAIWDLNFYQVNSKDFV